MKVVASEINKVHFFYLCPFCHKHHKHGSDNQFHNRVEHRGSHCSLNKENMEIYINDYTVRTFNRRKRKSPTIVYAKETKKGNSSS